MLNLLLDIEKDDYLRYFIDGKLEKADRNQKTNIKHDRGIKIEDTDIQYVNENKWLIKSQSSSNKEKAIFHEITYIQSTCFEDYCFSKCNTLTCIGLCSHLYKCNCQDIDSLCKHIHKIHSFRVPNLQAPSFIATEVQDDNYT